MKQQDVLKLDSLLEDSDPDWTMISSWEDCKKKKKKKVQQN